MKEIVVNHCYGGFGLSLKAIKSYLKLQGKETYFYQQTGYEHRDGKDTYTRIEDNGERHFLTFVFTKDFGKVIHSFPKSAWSKYHFYDRDIPRDNPDLITVVKELGEQANGTHAKLEIIEIPDGVDWTIEEYDGQEWVAEKHRTW